MATALVAFAAKVTSWPTVNKGHSSHVGTLEEDVRASSSFLWALVLQRLDPPDDMMHGFARIRCARLFAGNGVARLACRRCR